MKMYEMSLRSIKVIRITQIITILLVFTIVNDHIIMSIFEFFSSDNFFSLILHTIYTSKINYIEMFIHHWGFITYISAPSDLNNFSILLGIELITFLYISIGILEISSVIIFFKCSKSVI